MKPGRRLLARPGLILRPHDLNSAFMLHPSDMAVKRKIVIFSGNFNIFAKKQAISPQKPAFGLSQARKLRIFRAKPPRRAVDGGGFKPLHAGQKLV